nr:MAG TPA: hypothetical protein [Caudoviricetes sp.]
MCSIGSSGCPFASPLAGSPAVRICPQSLVFTEFLLVRLVVHVLVHFLVHLVLTVLILAFYGHFQNCARATSINPGNWHKI